MNIHLFELILSAGEVVDLMSPAVNDHQKRVTYAAHAIAQEMGLGPDELSDIAVAAALHDIGALSLKEKLDLLEFEVKDPHLHAMRGAHLLGMFRPFERAAKIVRYHHQPWRQGEGAEGVGEEVPLESHIINLADRVAVLAGNSGDILERAEEITLKVAAQSGSKFHPDAVEAFRALAGTEYFWFDLMSPTVGRTLEQMVGDRYMLTDASELEGFAMMTAQMIDFRSRFTATHTSGVAACAEELARRVGFDEEECMMMKTAGYLHDLGKLAVPSEIIEKPAGLSSHEFNVMKRHPFYTYRLLDPMGELATIKEWAAFHHESLDGVGYPFKLKDKGIPLGSRVMAVADVFTAVTEDRPYRRGMEHGEAVAMLEELVVGSRLDGDVVRTVRKNFEEFDNLRVEAQGRAKENFREFMKLS
jgi:HD-GYP domain-containing protein (c-di-GMP phosphodiesterase class II)